MPNDRDWLEWRFSVDQRLETGDATFKRIEEKIDRRYDKANSQHRETMAKFEGLRRLVDGKPLTPGDLKYDDEDSEEISQTTDIEALRGKSRRLRTRARRGEQLRKWGKYLAPFLVGVGAGLWEILKRTVLK